LGLIGLPPGRVTLGDKRTGLALLAARRFSNALPLLRGFHRAPRYITTREQLLRPPMEEAKFFIEARNRVGPPICASLLRQNLGGFAHCDVFVEGLVKAGVPE
jgi:adenylate cyclase